MFALLREYPAEVTAKAEDTTGTQWEAVYRVAGDHPDGELSFEVTAFDPSGNTLAVPEEPENTVQVDLTKPTLGSLALSSGNLGVTDLDRPSHLLATAGDRMVLSFTTSERIASPESGEIAPKVVFTNEAGAEVIVVEDAGGDGSDGMVREEFAWAKLVALDTNVGYSCATNLGCAKAQGEYLLLLNADTEVRPGAVDALLSFARSHPEHGAVAPRLVGTDGGTQASCMAFPQPLIDAISNS